jgi:hypothetical protein
MHLKMDRWKVRLARAAGPTMLALLLTTAVVLNGRQVKADDPEEPPTMTPRYDLYIGFSAKTNCVPEKGPYLTELSYDFHIPKLRFNFTKRALDGLMVNWYPHHGEGNEPAYPVLTFMSDGQVDAALCPHQLCPIKEGSSKRTLKKAWFTKQNKTCRAVVSVVALPDIPDVVGDALEIDTTGTGFPVVPIDIKKQTAIMHVKIMANDNFAYTGECTYKGQDAGGTGGLEFYLILPSWDLRNGRTAEAVFPFKSDDIDAEGQLTIRFLPVGSIK